MTHRNPCAGYVPGRKRCYAREGSPWCANHDPAEAERRKAAGRVRYDANQLVGLKPPPLLKIVDDGVLDDPALDGVVARDIKRMLLKTARDARSGVISAKVAYAMTMALKGAAAIVLAERRVVIAEGKGSGQPWAAPAPENVDGELRADVEH